MNTVDDIPDSVFNSIPDVFSIPDRTVHVQRQINLHVTGQLHEMVDDNYHRVYDLGDPEGTPENLGDVRLYSTEFQSVKSAYLEETIITTTLLKE